MTGDAHMKITDQDLMQYEIAQIEKYDWDTPIDENPELAHLALNLCYKRLFMPWLNMGWPPKRPISICMGCKKPPSQIVDSSKIGAYDIFN